MSPFPLQVRVPPSRSQTVSFSLPGRSIRKVSSRRCLPALISFICNARRHVQLGLTPACAQGPIRASPGCPLYSLAQELGASKKPHHREGSASVTAGFSSSFTPPPAPLTPTHPRRKQSRGKISIDEWGFWALCFLQAMVWKCQEAALVC